MAASNAGTRDGGALDASLDGILGIDVHELNGERVVASFEIGDQHRQRFGIVHGGAYSAIAEFLASEGTVHGVAGRGAMAVGTSNHTSFLRSVSQGRIRITGRSRHRGRSTWLWEIDFEDPDGRLCATSRVALAVLESPPRVPEPITAPCSLAASRNGGRDAG